MSRMSLTVLGCSGSMPGPTSPASSYLVEADGARLVLDLGNGALGSLQRHAQLGDVDGVLISHLHPDHCNDLCGYYVALHYGPYSTRGRVPVWGPDGTAERMADAYGLPHDPGMTEVFDFRPYPPDASESFEVGPFRVHAARVRHPVPAYGVRVEFGGRSITYTGDTGPCDPLAELADGTDLLLCEAGHGNDATGDPGVHHTGKQAGELAAVASVGRLVVTHVPPWCDLDDTVQAARSSVNGPVDVAAVDRTWEV